MKKIIAATVLALISVNVSAQTGALDSLKSQNAAIMPEKTAVMAPVPIPEPVAKSVQMRNNLHIYTGIGKPDTHFIEVHRPGEKIDLGPSSDGGPTNITGEMLVKRLLDLKKVNITVQIIGQSNVFGPSVRFTIDRGLYVDYNGGFNNYANGAAEDCKLVSAELKARKFPVLLKETYPNPTDNGDNWSCHIAYIIS